MYTGNRDCCSRRNPPPCNMLYVPMVLVQVPQECCDALKVPRDLTVGGDTASQTALIGGSSQVSLSLEYLIETVTESTPVTVNTTADGVTSSWSDTATTVGHHVREALMSVKPGTKVTLESKTVTARLRWCETVCC